MRKLFLVLWLLVPLAAAAYHFGPGQQLLRVDRAASLLASGDRAAAAARSTAAAQGDDAARSQWGEAAAAYAEALEQLPPERVREIRLARLGRDSAQMFLSQMPEARSDLESLVGELAADAHADPDVLARARASLANAQYYMTWLKRLEGAPRQEWEPEIEASRQTYKLLAEQFAERGEASAAREAQENVESAIRLARLDLSDLQGLPLPSQ
jgi:hypothetical protein